MPGSKKKPAKGGWSRGLTETSLFAALVVAFMPAFGQEQAPLERTMSSSGEFSIYGSNPATRLGVARKVDLLLEGWTSAFPLPGEKLSPIVINLINTSSPRTDNPRTTLFLGDGNTMKIQIDTPPDLVAGANFEIEVIRALALEFAYREKRPLEGKPYTSPPDWLVEGAWQEITARKSGVSAKLFEHLLKQGPPPKIKAFLRQRPKSMDPTSQAVYRAQAMTLLRALSALDPGNSGFARYLSALHGHQRDDVDALTEAFPALSEDPTALVKLWTLAMARASAANRGEFLSAVETGQKLAEILDSLQVRENPKDQKSPLISGAAAMIPLSREESGRYVLREISENLLRLEGSAHPLYRPIVEEYRSITSDLTIRRRRGAEKKLAAVTGLHAALETRVEAITDYLNWFEATQLVTPSEAFSEALGQAPSLSIPERQDPISRALDVAEQKSHQ